MGIRYGPRSSAAFEVYSVKTTGVFCRPSCAARLPKPENVQFHATCEDAEEAGFRPCKRCKPNQASPVGQHAEKIASACRLIESYNYVKDSYWTSHFGGTYQGP